MLSIAGHDPGGGAGIQADIETASALGVHAATIISCLTVQDTINVYSLESVSVDLIRQQFETLTNDLAFDSCKIGLIGTAVTAELLVELLADKEPLLILDPILAAGGGKELAAEQLQITIKEKLLPITTLVTPNLPEAQRLTGQSTPEECAATLIHLGCDNALITGGHEEGNEVINRLYNRDGLAGEWNWPRLPGDYHGTGCTLSSAIAALLAKGVKLYPAVEQAQRFTQNTLLSASTIGQGQLIPNRRLND